MELRSFGEVRSEKVNHQEECLVFPTSAIKAIIMTCSEWETNSRVQRFLEQPPVSTNYLIETSRDWKLKEHRKVFKILDMQRVSTTPLDVHIHLPNLNDQCQLGLSWIQAVALRDIDSAEVYDWSKVFPTNQI